MICRSYGRDIRLVQVRDALRLGPDGASMGDLCRGASPLGLAARSIRVAPSQVAAMPLPAILHWKGDHWVVLHAVDRGSVWIADPALGLQQLSHSELGRLWTGHAVLFDNTQRLEQAWTGSRRFLGLGALIAPYRGIIAQSLGLALVGAGLQMALPIFTQIVVDRVLVEHDLGLLRTLVAGVAATAAFTLLAGYLQRYLLVFVAVRVDASSLDFYTRKLLALPLRYFQARSTGDILRRLAGLREIRGFLVGSCVEGVTAFTVFVAAMLVMLLYSPLLCGLFLVTGPLYLALMRFSARRLRPLHTALEEAFGLLQSQQIDMVQGIVALKSSVAQDACRERMVGQFHEIARRVFRTDLVAMVYEGGVQALMLVQTTLILYFGAQQVMENAMTIGGFVAFNALVVLATGPLGTALKLWDDLQVSTILFDRLSDIADQRVDGTGGERRPLPALRGAVTVHDLRFGYDPSGATEVLRGIHLDIPAGSMLAIVGHSGSGKTTLAKCLAGLLEPTAGRVLYDGIDGASVDPDEVRRQIGFVPQENHVFGESVACNIALAELEPDLRRVEHVARVALVHDVISRLPLGYDTLLGETGVALSGGQLQRLSLARALYYDPPILILDEATSALDTETEAALQESFGSFAAGCTRIVVAHRLSTVRRADSIVVLENGVVAEQGTHEELMSRRAAYWRLNRQQLGDHASA